MQQIEVVSWKTLKALKQAATIEEIFGDLDTNEQMAVFCTIEEDYLELYFSELESNYIRHFEDEEQFLKYIEIRKTEFGEEDYDSIEYYDDDGYEAQEPEDEYADYKIKDEDEEEDFLTTSGCYQLMNEKKATENKKWASYATIGMMFPASIAIGLAIGYFLDEFFHTSPYLLIIFTIYGVAAGFWNLIKITGQDGKKR